jgi:hypothetical protein
MSYLKLAVLVVALVLAGVVIFGERSPPKERACGSTTDALVMSRTFVKQRLKAPSTATFARLTDPEVRITSSAPCQFAVLAWVDAQNGFGAMIRSRYSMNLRHDAKEDMWHATGIMILD